MEMEHFIQPDPDTGKCPTARQFEIMMLLNPFMDGRCKSYDEVAEKLGVTHQAVVERMRRLRERCPNIYARFRKCRFKEHNHWHKKGCKFCGRDIPVGQDICSLCWARRERNQNPSQYRDYVMFPLNGPTRSTIDMEKNKHIWEKKDYVY